jgi:peptidyl-prolyl cis-trans isomerase C
MLDSITRPWSVVVLAFLMAQGMALADGDEVHKTWTLEYQSPRFLDMGDVTITQTDVDAYLLDMPAERRPAFLASAERIGEMLNNLVLMKSFVPMAMEEGLLDDPAMQAHLFQKLAREVRSIYREWFLESIELDDYSARAREIYLTNPQRFRGPETLDFHHLLVVAGNTRSEVEAMARVLEAHEMLSNGAEFAEVAEQYSDDPSVHDNAGFFEGVKVDELVEQVAAALGNTPKGELASPVRTRFGWHIVVLDAVHEGEVPEWEAVKDRAIRMARRQHRNESYERLLRDIQDVRHEFAEGSVAALLVRYGVVDEDDRPTEDRITPLLMDD